MASTLALEAAMGVVPTKQGRYLRDILHGCEFLQNHIRHFYQYTIPDFVRLPDKYPLYVTDHNYFRLPKDKNDEIAAHYFESLDISRSAHEMLAVLGGKAPHNHGIIDTTRGALGHWLKIDHEKLSLYQIITPSAWNLSTRGNNNLRGTSEQALVGTTIQNLHNPVELGRIIRSFDPCVSCVTHVYLQGECIKAIQVVP